MAIELDFFEKNETILLLEEMKKIKKSSDAVRKSVFARINEFEKTIKDIRNIIKEEENEHSESKHLHVSSQ